MIFQHGRWQSLFHDYLITSDRKFNVYMLKSHQSTKSHLVNALHKKGPNEVTLSGNAIR